RRQHCYSVLQLLHKGSWLVITIFWYRQYPGKPPEFLISHTGTGKEVSDPVSGLSFKVSEDQTRMDLNISSAAVSDSAVYYCAVKPTVTGNTKTLYKNLWSKDNTILHNIHWRESHTVTVQCLLLLTAEVLLGRELFDSSCEHQTKHNSQNHSQLIPTEHSVTTFHLCEHGQTHCDILLLSSRRFVCFRQENLEHKDIFKASQNQFRNSF
uniref:Immunoglobulin V-set domain-containing protein n=1 Tax=Seriola dumerili TaxID=41447 RepID=A0A3B4VR40_SERDU